MHMETLEDVLALTDIYERELPPAPEPELPQGLAIAKWIDHTLLKPEATQAHIERLCAEARQAGFATVCVNPCYVALAARLLQGSPVAVCTVVGFPLGATLTSCKVLETIACLENGAREMDMVISIGALKSQALGQVLNDIHAVVQVAHNRGAIVKVIIETALLNRREKILACLLSRLAGADFVKTSTGFASAGATVEDVALMRRVVGTALGVKAAGGIRTWQDALAMIRAGATRIGASAGMQILEQALAEMPSPAAKSSAG